MGKKAKKCVHALEAELPKKSRKKKKEEELPPRSITDLKEHEKLTLRPLPMHLEKLVIDFAKAARKDARKAEEDIGKVIVQVLTDKIAATETAEETTPLAYCRVCDVVADTFDAFYEHILSEEHAERKEIDSVPLFAEVGPRVKLTKNQVVAREFMGAALLEMDDLEEESAAGLDDAVEVQEGEEGEEKKNASPVVVVNNRATLKADLLAYCERVTGVAISDGKAKRLIESWASAIDLPASDPDALLRAIVNGSALSGLYNDKLGAPKNEAEAALRKVAQCAATDLRKSLNERLKEEEERKKREQQQQSNQDLSSLQQDPSSSPVVDRAALLVDLHAYYEASMKEARPDGVTTWEEEGVRDMNGLLSWCAAECALPFGRTDLTICMLFGAALVGLREQKKGRTEEEVHSAMQSFAARKQQNWPYAIKSSVGSSPSTATAPLNGDDSEVSDKRDGDDSHAAGTQEDIDINIAKAAILHAAIQTAEEASVTPSEMEVRLKMMGQELQKNKRMSDELEGRIQDLTSKLDAAEEMSHERKREVYDTVRAGQELARRGEELKEQLTELKTQMKKTVEWSEKEGVQSTEEQKVELSGAMLSSLSPADIVEYRLKKRPCAECAKLWAEYGALLTANGDVQMEFAFRSHPLHPCVALLNITLECYKDNLDMDSDDAVRSSTSRPVKFPSKEQLKELGAELEKEIYVPLALGDRHAYSCTENFQVAMHDHPDEVRAVYEKFMEMCMKREGRSFFCDICRVVLPSGRHFRLHLLSEQHDKKTGKAPARLSSLYNPLCQMVCFIDVVSLMHRKKQKKADKKEERKEERKRQKREKEEAEKAKAEEEKRKKKEEEERDKAKEGSHPPSWFPAFAVANPARIPTTTTKVFKKVECIRTTTVAAECSFIPLVEVTPDDVPPGFEKIVEKCFYKPK